MWCVIGRNIINTMGIPVGVNAVKILIPAGILFWGLEGLKRSIKHAVKQAASNFVKESFFLG